MMRARRGFTLWETALVLAILAIVITLAAPAGARFGADVPQTSADGLLRLLHDSRKLAIDSNAVVWLRVDPSSGKFRVDSTGLLSSGEVTEGTLSMGATEKLETSLERLVYIFQPTGAGLSDSVLVRGGDRPLMVFVDPWSGVARAEPR
jgi:prepilin-type N-terminal cleavage/methylation domain-containing protein